MEENRFKQRIVGAVVLVALGVIFIPMLLSGGRDDGMPPFGSNIPDKPRELSEMKVVEMENITSNRMPEKPLSQPLQDAAPESEQTSPALAKQKPGSTPAKKKPAAGKSDAASVGSTVAVTSPRASVGPLKSAPPKAWVVQLGSFSKQSNAIALRDKLRKHKYHAFVESIRTAAGKTYRVRVGPEVRRSEAEKTKQRIKTKLNIDGVVMGHP